MICKCNAEMDHFTNDYDGREDKLCEYHWCPKCGRMYCHFVNIRYEDKDYWQEPESIFDRRLR